MKKLFLASSFTDVSKLFPGFIGENCQGKSVTFIPTASIVEEVNFYVAAAQKAFEELGMVVDNLDISQESKDKIESKLRKNDIIYVSGGNTFFLLQELIKSGADQIIIDQINNGKMYVGESAGSVVLSPDIEYVSGVDDGKKAEALDSCKSLGVVDFYPVPHYKNFPFVESVDKIISEYETKLDLYPISNNQVITVHDDEIKVIG